MSCTSGKLAVAVALLLALVAVAGAADEACTGVSQCSLEISATETNSQVTFPFVPTGGICLTNSTASANTVYVSFSVSDAEADADVSHPLTVGNTVCVTKRTRELNLICAAGETATVQVLALVD